ncbi:hypothetical protein G7Y89_g6047 [Cudoniella acicularis]|uniref:3-ketodihydrosphingosine reductase n=1 Tax=Cudoniella acicularis TaxID=354080 RepID=A0A8H4W5X0_9HELO|nr:hypothetical protein G7Y89_g6047 [Cudoniella acicularis]
MSVVAQRNIALAALAGVGALFAANALMKPSKTQSIANGMRRQLDEYNSNEAVNSQLNPPSQTVGMSGMQVISFIAVTLDFSMKTRSSCVVIVEMFYIQADLTHLSARGLSDHSAMKFVQVAIQSSHYFLTVYSPDSGFERRVEYPKNPDFCQQARKELAKALAAQGAHITIFARRQQQLHEARDEILAVRAHTSQEINAVILDLADASQVEAVFRTQPRNADGLYCVAGGTTVETGFLADINSNHLEQCMRNNYLTSAYAAQAMLKIWTEDDKQSSKRTHQVPAPKDRQIIFVSSAAAFVGFPGYIAYTPAKCAVRALADTLRAEALIYSCSASTYKIHCAFPSNFISPAFIDEQNSKPELTKRMEGTTASTAELAHKLHSSEQVARYIISAVRQGDFAICSELEAAVLFANMIGPSPTRGLGIVDSLLALLMRFIIWPILRRHFDAMCAKEGLSPKIGTQSV